MKKIALYFSLALAVIACNDDKKYSNEEADTRQHNQETVTGQGDNSNTRTDDTTSTMNNNAYNTDSASGQGNRYDSSNAGKK
jgi:hypothetical protein